jgi:hypothetical protein
MMNSQSDSSQIIENTSQNDIYGWVNLKVVNARIAPTTKAQIIAKLSLGARINLIEPVDEVVAIGKPTSRWWRSRINNYDSFVYLDSSLISLTSIPSGNIFEKINFDSTSREILEEVFKTKFELDLFWTYHSGKWITEGKVSELVFNGHSPRVSMNGISFSQITLFVDPDTIPFRLQLLSGDTYSSYNTLKAIFCSYNYKLIDTSIDGWGNEYGCNIFDDIKRLYIGIGEKGLNGAGAGFAYRRNK